MRSVAYEINQLRYYLPSSKLRVVPVSISGIRKPQIARLRMLDNIVEGRKVTSQEIVQDNLAGVLRRIDQNELGWTSLKIAFVAKDDLLAFVAVGCSADWIECSSTVGLCEVWVTDRGDRIVVVDVDDGDVDWVVDVTNPVYTSVLAIILACLTYGFNPPDLLLVA